MSQLFWTLSMSVFAQLRNLGIGGLKAKITKLKKIEFLQFLNPSIPEFLNPSIPQSLSFLQFGFLDQFRRIGLGNVLNIT